MLEADFNRITGDIDQGIQSNNERTFVSNLTLALEKLRPLGVSEKDAIFLIGHPTEERLKDELLLGFLLEDRVVIVSPEPKGDGSYTEVLSRDTLTQIENSVVYGYYSSQIHEMCSDIDYATS